jgi:hypothetical protein
MKGGDAKREARLRVNSEQAPAPALPGPGLGSPSPAFMPGSRGVDYHNFLVSSSDLVISHLMSDMGIMPAARNSSINSLRLNLSLNC